jgi:hypothetical protein
MIENESTALADHCSIRTTKRANIKDGISIVAVAETALNSILRELREVRELYQTRT